MQKKIKLAICSKDVEYRERFIRCWMHHYKSEYEIYAYETVKEIIISNRTLHHVIITDYVENEDIEVLRERQEKVIVLYSEDVANSSEEVDFLVCEHKYQELYKIQKTVQGLVKEKEGISSKKRECKMIGVYSLGCENQQIPFCAMAASEYGEKGKTLIINLQQNSGMETDIEAAFDSFGMEDVMTISETGIYTKARLFGAVGHEEKWDYIYSVKNSECLAEATNEMYERMIEVLVREMQYENIIINFGTVFPGMYRLMKGCDRFYFLVNKSDKRNYRENVFLKELEVRGFEDFIQKMIRIEIPVVNQWENGWKQIARQWRWSSVGDHLRWSMWEG